MSVKTKLTLIIILIFSVGCGGGDPEIGETKVSIGEVYREPLLATASYISDDKLDTHFDVKWNPKLQLLRIDDLNALLSYDLAKQIFIFDTEKAEGLGLDLEEGNPLLISGLALGKIKETSITGSKTTVTMEAATLEDAIDEGELGFDHEVEFTNEMFEASNIEFRKSNPDGEALSVDSEDVSIALDADGTVSYRAKVGSFKYDMKFNLTKTKMEVAVNIVKELKGSPVIRFFAVGEVQAPTHRFGVKISSGKLEDFEFSAGNMTGTLRLGVIAAGSGEDDLGISLPAPIFKFPVLIGGVIPAIVEMEIVFGIGGSVPPGTGSVQMETTFVYDSNLGFTYDKSVGIRETSKLMGFEAKDGKIDMASNFIPMAATILVGLPKTSIKVFGSASAALQLTSALLGELTFGPVCKKATYSLSGLGGYDISILGLIPVANGKKEFFKKEKVIYQDTCDQ